MAFLELIEVKKKYKEFTLSVSLEVEKGEILSLLGPSGAGKSTLLSLISGSEECDSGRIVLNGRDITKERMQKRNIGMLFQDFTLFPSMNTEKNIMYGMSGLKKKDRKEKTKSLLSLVSLSGYEKRRVTSLSGGEAQRVALARTLSKNVDLLLLDEPFSALDAPLRRSLRSFLKELSKSLNLTMIYVTHDISEAFALSERIALLREGRIESIKGAEDLYAHPGNKENAFFTGEGTLLPASLFFPERGGTIFFRPENVEVRTDPFFEREAGDIVISDPYLVSSEFRGSHYSLVFSYKEFFIKAMSKDKPKGNAFFLLINEKNIVFW